MFRRLNQAAQTTAEYAILIALVVGALVAMQVYVRRGLQGKIKEAVDYTGGTLGTPAATNFSFSTSQYEPKYSSSNVSTNQNARETENMQVGGSVNRGTNATTNVTRNQAVDMNY